MLSLEVVGMSSSSRSSLLRWGPLGWALLLAILAFCSTSSLGDDGEEKGLPAGHRGGLASGPLLNAESPGYVAEGRERG